MRSLMIFAVLAGSPALAADGEALLAAAELPKTAKELRDAGLDADQVTAAIDAAKAAELNAADTSQILKDSAPLVKEHGPVDNFGELVKSKLEEGLRGEDLAAAIKEAHGKGGGKPEDAGDKGKAEAADKGEAPAAKPRPKPAPIRKGPMVRPGSKLNRPGGGAIKRPGGRGGGGTAPKPSSGGGMTRPGGGR